MPAHAVRSIPVGELIGRSRTRSELKRGLGLSRSLRAVDQPFVELGQP